MKASQVLINRENMVQHIHTVEYYLTFKEEENYDTGYICEVTLSEINQLQKTVYNITYRRFLEHSYS